MILCLISVICRVCLNGLLMSLFCSIVQMGTRKIWIFFHSLSRLIVYLLFYRVLVLAVEF